MLRLTEGKEYEAVDRSGLLPLLTADDVTRFVTRMLETDETDATLAFDAWLRRQIKKPAPPRKKET